jgi:hypothetical protein
MIINNGYNYGPVMLESLVWITVLVFMAVLAWVVSLFCGDFQELVRFFLTIGFMVILGPIVVYLGADLLGVSLPSLHPDRYWTR